MEVGDYSFDKAVFVTGGDDDAGGGDKCGLVVLLKVSDYGIESFSRGRQSVVGLVFKGLVGNPLGDFPFPFPGSYQSPDMIKRFECADGCGAYGDNAMGVLPE